ncbi:RNA polymerase sigma factor [Gilvimarinus agarilyticus]|uniref:RNA polymerase sigma factor n=1 Tax=unclassified Gilvimarinus TaxID=2642066 RepID=UPI001C082D97|nr:MULTISPECIES: RNA polymerase sigma factor [unclassified Gilvimarinus]MBU2887104.1 RNA polymerase sigma factor [Gilvimarinus agarilyticus]MDO6571763.1 RNA polymerase sigma factor [Gilvimarinus sp. 2_MG-2023]MDO6745835.1 RNA polymerase sigma factor [Gilvimarinus sp. 1_MG-2023]
MSYLERNQSILQVHHPEQETTSKTFLNHVKAIRQHASTFFKNSQDVDDLVQEVYVKVIERGGLSDVRAPKAFLCKVARNLAINEKNRSGVRLNDSIESAINDHNTPTTIELDEQAEQHQRFIHFCDAINRLPAQCRRIFIMKKIEGISNSDIARQLNISVGTVDKHLAKGMIECKESLKQLGHFEPALKEKIPPALKTINNNIR